MNEPQLPKLSPAPKISPSLRSVRSVRLKSPHIDTHAITIPGKEPNGRMRNEDNISATHANTSSMIPIPLPFMPLPFGSLES